MDSRSCVGVPTPDEARGDARAAPDTPGAGTRRIRVLIADDHPPTRLGVRGVLERAGMDVCAEVATGDAAVAAALVERPDICLLEVSIPGDGIAAAERISTSLPGTAVVMLTESEDHLLPALQAGAVGYLLKNLAPERLPSALAGVLRGEAALPRHLVSRLVDEFQRRGRRHVTLRGRPSVSLTSREWEVLEAMRTGLSTKEISAILHVSPVTVRTHVSTILRKLDVTDRSSALRLLEHS